MDGRKKDGCFAVVVWFSGGLQLFCSLLPSFILRCTVSPIYWLSSHYIIQRLAFSLLSQKTLFLDSTSSGLPFCITNRPFFIIISSIHTYQFDNFLIDNVHIWLYSICCPPAQSVFLIYQYLFTFCLCLKILSILLKFG